MSTQPGVTSSPSASMTRRAGPTTRPPSVTTLPSTATSAVRVGPPDPSATVPPRMIRSCMGAPPRYSGRSPSEPASQLFHHGDGVRAHGRDVEMRDAGFGHGGHALFDVSLGATERGRLEQLGRDQRSRLLLL